MNAKIRTISRRTWNAAQSWNYEELLEIVFPTGSAKLRLTIRSNAYVDQSYGTLERWDGSRWQQVVHRAGVELQSRNGASGERRPVSYTSSSLSPEAMAAFEADRKTLLDEAQAVLG